MANNLPLAVIRDIASFALSNETPKLDLLNYMRVPTTWKRASEPHMYSNITVKTTRELRQLFTRVQHHRNLGANTIVFYLAGNNHDDFPVTEEMIERISNLFPRLEQLYATIFINFREFYPALVRLRQATPARFLRLKRVTIPVMPKHMELYYQFVQVFSDNIEELGIGSEIQQRPIDFYDNLINICTNLKTLCLSDNFLGFNKINNVNYDNKNIGVVVPKESVVELFTRRGSHLMLLNNGFNVNYINQKFPNLQKMNLALLNQFLDINYATQLNNFMDLIVSRLPKFDLRHLYVRDENFGFLVNHLWRTAGTATRMMNITYFEQFSQMNPIKQLQIRRNIPVLSIIHINVRTPITLDINKATVLVQQNNIDLLKVYCHDLYEMRGDPERNLAKFNQLIQGLLHHCLNLTSFILDFRLHHITYYHSANLKLLKVLDCDINQEVFTAISRHIDTSDESTVDLCGNQHVVLQRIVRNIPQLTDVTTSYLDLIDTNIVMINFRAFKLSNNNQP